MSAGKSRADLWQLAANTALEVKMANANYNCRHEVSFQQFVVALEGQESCLWRLHKPVPFQYEFSFIQVKVLFPFPHKRLFR
jgi:hypothetical protein